MKKRVLAGMLMMVMVLATVMSVSAADSKTNSVVANDTVNGKYETTVDVKNGVSTYEELTDAAIDANTNIAEADKAAAKVAAKEALQKIADINAGKTVSITTDVDKAIEGKTLVQKFFDLDEVGNHDTCHTQKYHTVTLSVDAMTTSWKNITVVHFSADRTVWETITPKVDYDKKTLTFDIKDLSPLAIYADIVADSASGKSPTTEGVSSAWMMWSAAALIVLGAGVVVSQKKKH